jgi:glycosyltransferase involved in cell wall biosynthesis
MKDPGRAAPVPALSSVAVDLTPLLPGGSNGGARRFAFELVAELARQHPEIRFTLLTQAASHGEAAALDAPNVERRLVLGEAAARARGGIFAAATSVLRVTPAPLRALAARWGYRANAQVKRRGAAAALAEAHPQLLFCPFTAPVLRHPGMAVVSVLHDLQYRAFPKFFGTEDRAMRAAAVEDAVKHATRIAAVSMHAREQAIDLEGADPRRVVAIPHRLAPTAAAPRRPRTPVEPGTFLLYPANFWRHKNHERLLQAMKEIPIPLVLTGTRDGRGDEIRALATQLGISDRVVFAGYVDEDELQALMGSARALVFPSLYEGYGLPVIEAMAHGVPVACSNAAALPETVGDAALSFDPTDVRAMAAALRAITSDEPLRERLVARGRERAREFADTPRMAREYHALFLEALAEAWAPDHRRVAASGVT